jgi:hypothetical protein
MVAAVTVRSSEADVLSVERASGSIKTTEGFALGVYNVPAVTVRSTQADISVVYRWTSQSLEATQGAILAVVRGSISNPSLRSWYYTMDGHDFYVLKLGTGFKTLVYDLTTQQWAWWNTENSVNWRASVGMNWRSSNTIGSTHGSNVIVGDDSTGTLWVLDPDYPQDDSLFSTEAAGNFTRVATGQIPSVERKYVPIYSVNLSASFGNPGVTANTVTLTYSDDQGNNWVTADEPQVAVAGEYNQEFSWRSLGVFRAPGRLFQVTDDGAFARIDSLNVNE